MVRGAHILALIAVLAVGPGCFVIDELDSGLADMKGKEAKEEAPAPAPAPRTGARRGDAKEADPRAALTDWWKTARTPSSGPKDGGPAADIVSCRLGGKTLFTTRTDCEVQGGTF